MARVFPYGTTIGILIGIGGLGAQQLFAGPEWRPIWKWVMLGGFGGAAAFLIPGVIHYFRFRIPADQAVASPVSASGDHSVAISPQATTGSINTGSGFIANNITINPLPAAPQTQPARLVFDWNMQEAYRYRIGNLGREPTADDVWDIFRDFRQAARDGDLIVRGIPIAGPSPIFGIDAPHENIPATHWREMDFEVTAYALGGDARNVHEARTEPTNGPTSRTPTPYYGLQVSRAQVEALWPAAAQRDRRTNRL